MKKKSSFYYLSLITSCGIGALLVVWALLFLSALFMIVRNASQPELFEGKKPLNILVLGVDKVSDNDGNRSDTLLLISLNFKVNSALIISIPRDLIVKYGRNDENHGKINAIYKKEGINALERIIDKMLNIQINKYVVVDYRSFKAIVDVVGPLTVTVEEVMKYDDTKQNLHIDFKPGVYEMNAEDILRYVRFRKDKFGDLGRINRQRKIMNLILAKVKKNGMHTSDLHLIYKRIKPLISTDISFLNIYKIYEWYKTQTVKLYSMEVPYTFHKKDIFPDTNRIKNITLSIKEGKEYISPRDVKITILNNNSPNFKSFEYILGSIWKKVGFDTNVIGTYIHSSDRSPLLKKRFKDPIKPGGNYIISLTQDISKKELLEEYLKNLHKTHHFVFINCNTFEGKNAYIELIYTLTKARYYMPFKGDFIILIGRSNI